MATRPLRRRRRRRSTALPPSPPNVRPRRSSRQERPSAATALWQPQEEELRGICAVLEAHVPPNSDQARSWHQLQHYAQLPDFNNYLVFLLARGQALHQCLDSAELDQTEGAMDAIYKICEDVPEEFDVDVPGLSERPVNEFMPRMLQFFQSPHASLRKLSLGCINQYIVVMPLALYMSMDQYLEDLFVLVKDPSADVRKLVCSAWVQLIERRPSVLEPHLKNVTEMILQANKDSHDEVALEACKFWSVYCDVSMPPEGLREFLPCLIPSLVSNMIFTDDDELLADAEDDDDAVNAWNLLRCSAAGLDALSNVFGDHILPTLMPLIQQKLARTDDESWKEQEAAVLSLGIVAEGCITGLCPYLQKMVALLTPLLHDDKFPLLRGTTHWTLSRYSKCIVQEVDRVRSEAANVKESNKHVVDRLCAKLTEFEKSKKDVDESLQRIWGHLSETIHQVKNVMAQWDSQQVEVDSLKASLDERTREAEGWKSKCEALKRGLDERTDELEGWKSKCEALKRGLEERTDESEGWKSKCEALKRAFDELSSKAVLSGRYISLASFEPICCLGWMLMGWHKAVVSTHLA